MSTRRSFLKQSALLTGGLLLNSSGFSQVFAPKKIIIIGAGLAGLAAAYQLKKRGIEYLLLESSNRVGGRVFSHQIQPGLVIELGGEWIGQSHTRIQELCQEFGLQLDNNQLDTHLIYKNQYFHAGKWNYSPGWERKFQSLLAAYPNLSEQDKLQLDRIDWWRYLVNNGCHGRDLDIRELLDSTDFGESIRQVSAFSALAEYAESSEKNEMDLKIRGGNALLAEKLAGYIGQDKIHLQQQVVQVNQSKGVEVICKNGERYQADALICTLPTHALLQIAWQPRLPAEKFQALNELQYARINKHALLFNERFWKSEAFDMVTDQSPHYFYHATKNQPDPSGVLISYTIGEKAVVMANQNNAWNAEMVQQTLSPYFGDIKSKLQQQVNYYWGNDARSHGAYALYGPGQWYGLRPILQAPFIQTVFAGEHLADWQGFMEGAINTGESAALSL